MALFVQQHVKGAIIVDHVTPPHGKKWLLYRMIVRELRQYSSAANSRQSRLHFRQVGISATLDVFSTVYELPLTHFKKGQTDRQTNKQTNIRT